MMQRAVEAEDIKNRLDPVKINKIDMMLVEWKSAVEDRWAEAEKAFDALGSDVMYPATLMPNVNAMTPKEAIAPIHRAALAHQTRVTLDLIGRMQKGMTWYKEMGTTDNQWIRKNPRVAASRGLKLQVSS
jgi:insecticidal toxin complex protein TccC